eukprot:3666950-Rhodomonas_salina.1
MPAPRDRKVTMGSELRYQGCEANAMEEKQCWVQRSCRAAKACTGCHCVRDDDEQQYQRWESYLFRPEPASDSEGAPPGLEVVALLSLQVWRLRLRVRLIKACPGPALLLATDHSCIVETPVSNLLYPPGLHWITFCWGILHLLLGNPPPSVGESSRDNTDPQSQDDVCLVY